jgi:hypothetical protein
LFQYDECCGNIWQHDIIKVLVIGALRVLPPEKFNEGKYEAPPSSLYDAFFL